VVDTLKVLGQSNPVGGVLTVLYTVPAATQTTVSSLFVCNLSSSPDAFSISIAVGGAADALSQYLYFTLPLDANDTFAATVGLSLAAGDVVRVLAANNNLTFSLFGVEIT
jgi:hypothetical protein